MQTGNGSDTEVEYVLFVLILIGRAGDILSTWLVTPKLHLEANPIMQKLGWRFALATLLVAVLPFFSPQMGLIILVPSLLVSASNISKAWFVRSYGEAEYIELLRQLARKSKRSHAWMCVAASTTFTALSGLVLMWLDHDLQGWSFWFAMGIVAYALAIFVHGTSFVMKLFAEARGDSAES